MSTDAASAANLRLVTGPAGSGKTQLALDRIREAATTSGPRAAGGEAARDALLVLPTYAQVMHVKRLALSRWDVRGILDDPFTTFTAAGERFLPEFRVRALPSAEERDRLMAEALDRAGVELFDGVADAPGFRARLLRLAKELKQTGLPAPEARDRLASARDVLGDSARERLDGFLSVFAEYEQLLGDANLEDHEDALRRLWETLRDSRPASVPGLLVVDGFDDFTKVEERILDALIDRIAEAGGEVMVTLPYDPARPALFDASAGARAHLLSRGFVESALGGFLRAEAAPLVRLADALFDPAQRGKDDDATSGEDAVQEIIAGDAEDEAESVAREVYRIGSSAAGGDPDARIRGWRDIGVILRRLDEQAGRFRAAFERLGVPVRVVGVGTPLASEPLVRGLRGALRVLAGARGAGRFEPREVTAWLRWRAFAGADRSAMRRIDAWEAGQREKGFPPDWVSYVLASPAALRPALDELDAAASGLAACRGAEAVYSAVADALPVLAPVPPASGLDARGRPLDPETDHRHAAAAAARERLRAILEGLRIAAARTGLGSTVRAGEGVAELLESIERAAFRLPDRRLDAVTLMDAEEARFWELPVVFVAGLEEGLFPLRPREDVLLRDRDRRALSDRDDALRLPLARDRETYERRLFYGAVTRAGQKLVLARRAFDESGTARTQSFFLRDLRRVVRPGILRQARAPGRVARPLAESYTRSDLLRWAADSLGPRTIGVPATEDERRLAAALQVAAGSTVAMRAEREMRAEADAVLLGDPAADDAVRRRFGAQTEVLSVSTLNTIVACPHRHFLASVVGVPTDELGFEGPEFSYREEGRALHDAFQRALEHPGEAAAEVSAFVVRELAVTGTEGELLGIELTRAVELLRRREKATQGPLRPWPGSFERGFEGEDAVPLGEGDGAFRLRGRIDRMDRAGDLVSVMDYKRSTESARLAQKAAHDELDLQLPLYARAIEALEPVEVAGIEWVASIARARRVTYVSDAEELFARRQEGVKPRAEDRETFRARIDSAEAIASDAVARVRAADHAKQPHDPAACEKCPVRSVCRPDVVYLRSLVLEEAPA